MKVNKDASKSRIMKNNFWLLKMIWSCTPGYVILMITEGVAWGINHSVSILYTKKLFDALEQKVVFGSVVNVILSYAIYVLLFYIFHYWYWHIYNPRAQERLHIALNSELFKQAVRIDLQRYDDPQFYNDFIWSMDKSYYHAIQLMEDTGKLINRIIASFTLTGVIFTIDETVAVIILAVALCRIGLTFVTNRTSLRYKEQLNPLERKEEYIKRVFRLPDYAKELRISHIQNPLFQEYHKTMDEEKQVIVKYGKKLAILKSVIFGVMIAGENALILLVLYKVLVTGTLGLSGFAVVVNASWKMAWLLGNMVERLMKYHEHGIFIEKMIAFLKCVPQITDGLKSALAFESLEIKNLTFGYEQGGTRAYAVDHVNMKIRKGEKIAIVGYNGAGKTTLTKLIMRLYDPDEGEILYNGENLKSYTIRSLRENMAAVFQDYRLFACSIAENVVGGVFDVQNEKKVQDALTQSTFEDRLFNLPEGIQTQLTREFSEAGTQLSGGEQQKVAIARAFYKNAGLIILDEPSSALDPDAEYALNQEISTYVTDRAVIFISHRLSTTKNADKIYVFDNGRIIESGNHDSLMKANGVYAYIFRLQAEKYRMNE